jgi:hypothetical protein
VAFAKYRAVAFVPLKIEWVTFVVSAEVQTESFDYCNVQGFLDRILWIIERPVSRLSRNCGPFDRCGKGDLAEAG